ncbi:MAG: electron transfer flavoprotein subunit beta, partial [Anaerolineales bacterium]|nr:electron transfer flavoprotein subunit beta [Anaerolineales bacterium]
YASLPNLIHALTYEPEVWTAESPVNFEREKIGMAGSPTIVFKVGTPEKPAPGQVIQTKELGIEQAVKFALQQMQTASVLSLG